MNSNYTVLLWFCLIIWGGQALHAQTEIAWSKTVGGSNNDRVTAYLSTSDGGFFLAGTTSSTNQSFSGLTSNSAFIAKFNAAADQQWVKSIGDASMLVPKEILRTPDGGFLIMGQHESEDLGALHGHRDGFLIKINANGNVIWEKTFGGMGDDIPNSIIIDSNGDFIVVGMTNSDFTDKKMQGTYDAWWARLSNQGELKVQHRLGGEMDDELSKIIRINSNYFAVGSSTSAVNLDDPKDGWFVELDQNGQIVSSKTFGGSAFDLFKDIEVLDEDLIVLGQSCSLNGDGETDQMGNNIWVNRIDNNGTLIWSKKYGSDQEDIPHDLMLFQNEIWLVGHSNAYDHPTFTTKGNADAVLLQLDGDGETIATTTMGGFQTDYFSHIALLQDQTLLLLGNTYSNSGDIQQAKGGQDIWLTAIGNNTIPTISFGDDISVCEGEQINLSADTDCTNCTYLWDDGTTTPERNIEALASSFYYLSMTNSQGTTAVDSIYITVNTVPTVSIEQSPISCHDANDGSINLSINSADDYTINWNTGATGATLTELSGGIYEVTISTENNCTASASATILNPSALVVAAEFVNPTCHGEANGQILPIIFGGQAPYQYEWSNGTTTKNLTQVIGGAYSLTLTDNLGCTIVKDYSLAEPAAIISNEIINETSIDLEISGGTSPYTVNWDNGDIGTTLPELVPGNYTYTITDAIGCTYTNMINFQTTSTEQLISTTIEISPNPTADYFQLSNDNLTQVELLHLDGRLIQQWEKNQLPNTFNVSTYPKGLYLIKVYQEEAYQVLKLVKQ